jgi:hypothetical protein
VLICLSAPRSLTNLKSAILGAARNFDFLILQEGDISYADNSVVPDLLFPRHAVFADEVGDGTLGE